MAKMNVELLERTKNLILANPRNFDVDQDPYFGIEGWVVTAAGLNVDHVDFCDGIDVCARRLLGISAAQAHLLFDGYYWPLKFRKQYRVDPSNTKDFRANARIAVARIEHFIAKGA